MFYWSLNALLVFNKSLNKNLSVVNSSILILIYSVIVASSSSFDIILFKECYNIPSSLVNIYLVKNIVLEYVSAFLFLSSYF